MRILLLGATGFIGRELFTALEARGHRVVAAIRRGSRPPPFATGPAIECDLERDLDPDAWAPRLADIDAVVNCAGILQARRGESSRAIHALAPAALFAACERCGVKRVVLISAISADPRAGTEYAASKLAGEQALRATALDWVVLRPSLVHASGAYGGTAFFRALAALPGIVPVPGTGNQAFQPIHVRDLCEVVALAVEGERLVRRTIDPVGPDRVALRDLLADYRRWLGFAPARIVPIPRPLVAIAARLGDAIGGPLNSTSLAQLEHGNTGDYYRFVDATGIRAIGWRDALARHPCHVQDRWHAQLYFVRPLLRATLAALWIASGFLGLASLDVWGARIGAALGAGAGIGRALLAVASCADLLIAALVLAGWRARAMGAVQAAVVIGYTIAGTLGWPGLWADPLGPLLKNLPILAAIAALAAIGEER